MVSEIVDIEINISLTNIFICVLLMIFYHINFIKTVSDYNNKNQIDEKFEQCKKMFEKLNAIKLLDEHTKEFLLALFSFGDITYEAKSKFIEDNQQHLIDLLDKQTIDPRFTKELHESNINMKLRSVFKAMEIKTL
jgi:hypothetical protein